MGQVIRKANKTAPLTIMARLREPYIRKIVQKREPVRILEVGAGQGAMGTRLAGMASYVGVEPDASSAAVATQRRSRRAERRSSSRAPQAGALHQPQPGRRDRSRGRARQ